jgi:hypothetical protein
VRKRPEQCENVWVNYRFPNRTLGTTVKTVPQPGDRYWDDDPDGEGLTEWLVERREFHPHYVAVIMKPPIRGVDAP